MENPGQSLSQELQRPYFCHKSYPTTKASCSEDDVPFLNTTGEVSFKDLTYNRFQYFSGYLEETQREKWHIYKSWLGSKGKINKVHCKIPTCSLYGEDQSRNEKHVERLKTEWKYQKQW